MGIWKDQLDMLKAATSPEMRQLVGQANAMERPSMLDGIRQANALMEQTAEQQRLLMSGVPGRARIDAAADTGATLDEQPVADLTMTVEVPGLHSYQVVTRQPIPRLMAASFAPGQTVPVKVDPANPTSLTFDMAAFAAAAGTAPAPGAIVPSQSPAERLERLAGLRDRGILSESEFAAQKARILAEM